MKGIDYYKKMLSVIKNDFKVMLKMLTNVDPNENEITEQTLPTLHAVKEIFLKSIEDNLEGMLQFASLSKVLSDKELILDQESLAWELDTEAEPEQDKPKGNIYM